MAASYVAEKPQSVRFEKGILTAKRVLQFKTARGDGPDVFTGHASLPAEGTAHPDFPGAFCISVELTQQENGVEWIAVIQYSSEREMAEDPVDDPVLVTWDGEIYNEAIFQDIDGDAIVNSAGDYFIDPSPTKEKTHLIAKIVANVTAVPTWLLTYRDVVNNSAINIDGLEIAEGLAMIRRPNISGPKKRGETSYREISYDVHIHPDGWSLKPLDAGFREKSGTDRIQIKNAGDDEEPTTPVPLDGSGAVLDNPTPSTVVFLEFDIYEPKDFTALPGISAVV